jgi:hypothetical protein
MTIVIEFTYQHHADHLYWLMLLGLIVMFGPGPLSLDRIIKKLVSRRFPLLAGMAVAVPHRAS